MQRDRGGMCIRGAFVAALATLMVGAAPAALDAQDQPAEGTAVVTVGQDEHSVVIECDDPGRPEVGFRTQPNRVTRERRGRSNGVNVGLRAWRQTPDVVVSVDRYVAWMPRPASSHGTLTLDLVMSPSSEVRDGAPVTLTYERWQAGERFDGKRSVRIEARCGAPDPTAPSYRKLGPPGSR